MMCNEVTGSFEGIFVPYNINLILIPHAESMDCID